MFSKTVVVGVDGSPESRVALRFALEDAHRRGAQVKAITAYLSPEYWAASYGLSALPTIDEVVEDNVIVAREALHAVVADAPDLAEYRSTSSRCPARLRRCSSSRRRTPSCWW